MAALVETGLAPEHFGDARYAEVWAAMVRCFERGEAVDVLMVGAELDRSGFAVLVAEARWVGGGPVPHLSAAPEYARRVVELASWRRALRSLPVVVDAIEREDRKELRNALLPFGALLRSGTADG